MNDLRKWWASLPAETRDLNPHLAPGASKPTPATQPAARDTSAEDQLGDLIRLCMADAGLDPETLQREYRFHDTRRWRFDYAVMLPGLLQVWKIAFEMEGGIWTRGRHVRGVGFEGDVEKYNESALHGWLVFRFTPAMLTDGRALAWIVQALELPTASRPPLPAAAGEE